MTRTVASPQNAGGGSAWPALDAFASSGTKRSVHLYAQMLGKIRVALSPPQPNWMFTALYLAPRGLTTGFIPFGRSSIEATLDVFASRLTLARSNGECRSVNLLPARTVADVYAELSAALRGLGIESAISTIPQEVPDTTPMDADRRPSEYEPAAVLRWFRAATATATVFESWRARFFGRSGIQLWWGAFDVALLLFSGRRVTAPTDRGYLMKYDLDAELMNVGLFFGDEHTAPFFYGYIYPQPAALEKVAAAPPATWSTQLNEWILPYDTVRAAGDPVAMLNAFVDSMYAGCFTAAGWNREAHEYALPSHLAPRPS